MATKVRIAGLRELEKALGELPKATGKSVLRRVLLKRGKPVADAMAAQAPDDPDTGGNDLKGSIRVSTKLSKRQRKLHRKFGGKAAVEAFVGAGPDPAAHNQEFGNINHGPQPFARPGWDATKDAVLDGIKDDLWSEIAKSAARLAKKQAKAAGA